MFHVPEPYRITNGPMSSDRTYGNNGAFAFRSVIAGRNLAVIASDGAEWEQSGLEGEPWEHVSIHAYQGKKEYTPTWLEMCQAKDMFWDKEDLVIQFHPRESDYVNNHAHTLHLWRPINQEIPSPPPLTVGLKDAGTVTSRRQAMNLAREIDNRLASEKLAVMKEETDATVNPMVSEKERSDSEIEATGTPQGSLIQRL